MIDRILDEGSFILFVLLIAWLIYRAVTGDHSGPVIPFEHRPAT